MHQARASGHENVTVKVTGKWVKNVVRGLYMGGGICGASAGRRRGTPKLLGIALFNFRKAPDIHLNLLVKLDFWNLHLLNKISFAAVFRTSPS